MMMMMLMIVTMTMTMIAKDDDRDNDYGDRVMDTDDFVVDIKMSTWNFMEFQSRQNIQFWSSCCQHLGCWPSPYIFAN